MKITGLSNIRVKADECAAYIPIVSTVTSLVNLFQKTVVMKFMKKTEIDDNHYYTHLKNTSYTRLVTLLFPVIGNLVIAVYDFHAYRMGKCFYEKGHKLEKEYNLEQLKHMTDENPPPQQDKKKFIDFYRQASEYKYPDAVHQLAKFSAQALSRSSESISEDSLTVTGGNFDLIEATLESYKMAYYLNPETKIALEIADYCAEHQLHAEAVRFLEIVAPHHEQSRYLLGQHYYLGLGIPQDKVKGMELIEQTTTLPSPETISTLLICDDEDLELCEDERTLGGYLFNKAFAEADLTYLQELGKKLLVNDTWCEEAYQCFEKSVDDPIFHEEIYSLACSCLKSEEDCQKGIKLLELLSECKPTSTIQASANYQLGVVYLRLKNIPFHEEKAINYLKLASDSTYPPAMFALGLYYLKSSKTKKEGLKLIEQAAAAKNEKALNYLKKIEQDTTAAEKKRPLKKYRTFASAILSRF